MLNSWPGHESCYPRIMKNKNKEVVSSINSVLKDGIEKKYFKKNPKQNKEIKRMRIKFDVKNKIKWYKSPKSIRVNMSNSQPGSWGWVFLI